MVIFEHLPALARRRIVLASQSPRRSQLLTQIGLKGFTIRVPTFEEDLPKSDFTKRAAAYAVATARAKALEVCRMEASDIAAAAAAAAQGGRGMSGATRTASVRALSSVSDGDEGGRLAAAAASAASAGGGAAAAASLALPDLLVGADTVVESPQGDILEKPDAGPEAHAAMLRSLSGAAHRVHTGVALVVPRPGAAARALPQRREGRGRRSALAAEANDGGGGGGGGGGSGSDSEGSTGPCLRETSLLSPEGWLVRTFAVSTRVRFAPLSEKAIAAYIESGEGEGKAGGYGIQGRASAFVSELVGDYFSVVGFPLHAFSAEVSALIEEGLLDVYGTDG